MHSCIYEGTVHHRRHTEVPRSFQYCVFMMYLDLAEIDQVFQGRLLWSASRPAAARFRRKDHIGPPSVPLDEYVRDLVENHIGVRPQGSVGLLTNLRYFGYLINPVSFYYCRDRNNKLQAVVADVTNTPWGERRSYVLDARDADAGGSFSAECDKELHVSPFLPMDMQYRWKVGNPADRLSVGIQNFRDGNCEFDAVLDLHRTEISGGSLARVLMRYPFLTGQTAARIYLQAFRLWRKRVTFYPHPKKTESASRNQRIERQTTAVAGAEE